MIFNYLLRKASRIARAVLIKAQLAELQYVKNVTGGGN